VQSALRLKKINDNTIRKETDNPKDSNAILVKVCVDDLFLIIGYIGVNKLPKVVSAIRKQEIVDIKVKSETTWLVVLTYGQTSPRLRADLISLTGRLVSVRVVRGPSCLVPLQIYTNLTQMNEWGYS
jgi:hypothetical protein